MVKFLILGDLHGRKPKLHFKDFDAIITPGDFCPIDYIRKLMFEVIREKQKDPDSKLEWYELCGKKKAKELVESSIEEGREILEELNSFDIPVYVVPGNADWTEDKKEKWDFLKQDRYKGLIKNLKNITDIYHKLINIGKYQFIGYGISTGPEYPQYKEDFERLKPEKLRRLAKIYEAEKTRMNKLFQKAKGDKPIIFLSHNVPFNTPIDEITDKNSPRCGYHYGSVIAREMVEKYQPLVCIGGHIHEHFGKYKIGKTICINAGFGSDANSLLEIEGNRIKMLEFYKK